MDLIARLRNWALARPRVLLVDAPGATTFRWSVEAELDRRGWRRAVSPADTDLLVVLGGPGPALAEAVDVLWSQVPEPRHRVDVQRARDVAVALDEGRAALVRRAGSGARGDDRSSPASLLGKNEDEDADDEGMDHGSGHEGMDHGSGHEGMDHGSGHEGMDHGSGHEGMDHGGEVAGLPMASTGPDRDGLELDVLKVALGPVLPGWPTGLVLRADLQGDVLTSAELAWLDAGTAPPAQQQSDSQRAALDRLARFLDVAGWPTAARDARRARDGAAEGANRDEAQRLAEALARRVSRSRTLAWTAGGIGRRGSGGEALDRVRRWCDMASGQSVEDLPAMSLDGVAALVEGAEIGSARLIVASLDLSPVSAVSAPGHVHA
ncbi:hypothetical protein FHU33_2518 [Blastococcus colisei]|uniref:Uncharacterized protein n=1 Tax=Blastococcus colisei TaxID=1564162 RepID=A0A543PG96_9ACTN|nr:hypothetical protein [Blastococcus colisei]TQN43094.1 hypothetical protein FHU33_2518 [Blastococcus colisei]